MKLSESELAIEAKQLTRKFKDKVAVDHVDLAIKKGEIYSFLGPNGSGKSTTIKMLVSLLDSSSGEIYINGDQLTSHSTNIRLQLGVALQEASLDEAQTGYELLYFQGRIYGLSRADIKKRIEELKPLVDIGDDLNKPVKTYSGGMKRRLDLAASIFHKPSILFLDEPTTGLDPISRNKVWEEVKKLNDSGVTIFLTTQYLEEADALADRVGIISSGKLLIEGTPSELKEQLGQDVIRATLSEHQAKNLKKVIPSIKKIDLVSDVTVHDQELNISSSKGSAVIGKVAVLFDKEGLEVDALTLRTTTLDDVFLKVTGTRLKQD